MQLVITGQSINLVHKLTISHPLPSTGPTHLVQVLESLVLPFYRIGVVRQGFIQTEKPADFLVTRFASPAGADGPFRRSQEFQIHNRKTYQPAGWGPGAVNSWVRLRVGSATVQSETSVGVILTQDINTPEEDREHDYQPRIVLDFAEVADREMGEIASVYFPDEEIKWSTEW